MRTQAHLEMQMWAGGVAGVADAGDLRPTHHPVAPGDEVFGIVRVDGDQVALVRQQNQVAVAALFADEEDDAVVGGPHRRSLRAGQVDALVMIAFAGAKSGDENARRRPGEGLASGSRIELARSRPRDGGRSETPRRALFDPRRWSLARRRYPQLAPRTRNEEEHALLQPRGIGERVLMQDRFDRHIVRARDPPESFAATDVMDRPARLVGAQRDGPGQRSLVRAGAEQRR